eukprot:CAMPEP_0194304762 /NCGR_PEP_ID=MMETSP0171-20130528/2396_1 /TAXON_ID=218684 /ORGANISM="Corethron pennatum, Strain L29A3" /LENGTH=218 /DNA_ID=CAMNT_0039056113 /DNA_START=134 /DNA_END=790 /DNA_ORIENTATION=+
MKYIYAVFFALAVPSATVAAKDPILSDEVINGAKCNAADVIVVSYACIPGSPHYDKEGDVCGNDGKRGEAYCSYSIGPNVCAYCNSRVIDGANCGESDIVIVDKNACIPGSPHYDKEGMICRNDGRWNEAYCSYDVGSKACAYCDNVRVIDGYDCDKDDVVIVDNNACIPGSPHYDKEGDICRNDGRWNEAYCSYDVGSNACAFCDNVRVTNSVLKVK